jgi:hypothetical protein
VLAELLEEEVVEVEIVGPKGKHLPERTAVRHGHEVGEVTLGGRRVAADWPRVRGADGRSEVRLRTYERRRGDGCDAGPADGRGSGVAVRPAHLRRSAGVLECEGGPFKDALKLNNARSTSPRAIPRPGSAGRTRRCCTGDVPAAVADLKESSGAKLVIMGSGVLIGSLMAADLIDEYLLLIAPLVLGAGRRLLPAARRQRCGWSTAAPRTGVC